MSSEVWNAAQKTNAKDMYDSYYRNDTFWGRLGTSDVDKLGKITSMCNEMKADFEHFVDEQNDYIIEFNGIEAVYTDTQNDIQEEIEKLVAEIKELEAKEDDGTITEEETKELQEKKARVNSLYAESKQNNTDTNNKVNAAQDKIHKTYSEKASIATDYSNFAIEKGNSFLDEDISKKEKEGEKIIITPWTFNKYIKHVSGKTAITAGEDLSDVVQEATGIDKKISSKKIR